MSKAVHIVLLLIAFVCFLVAAFLGERFPRVGLVALGLAAWVAVPLGDLVFG